MCVDPVEVSWTGVHAAPIRPARTRRPRRSTQAVVAAAVGLCAIALLPARTGVPPVTATGPQSGAPSSSVVVADADFSTATTVVPASEPTAPPSAQPAATAAATPRAARTAITATRTARPAARQVGVAAANPGASPGTAPAAGPATYSRDLYDGSLIRYQNPDGTACTATATEVMLNLIAARGTRGDGFVWAITTSWTTQEDILAWERSNDTLDAGALGSDPHGWRNALNHYGWNSFQTFGDRHYEDLSYSSFDAAVKAAVAAIARENEPVGILAWSGGHAQVMTGYTVYGQDPASSSDFTVQSVFLFDPLSGDGLADARISYSALQSGSTTYRFTPYDWTDSAADDPYMPGNIPSWQEWYGKWVIIAPVTFGSASPGSR